jgi:hypothetical protein
MNQNTEENIYDINKFTDEELYSILDLNSPTDRELEAKIIFLIRKYENMQNESGDNLADFFKKIHNRFFYVDAEEADDIADDINDDTETQPTNTIYINPFENSEPKKSTFLINETSTLSYLPQENPRAHPSLKEGMENITDGDNIKLTKTLDYAAGKINPLLKQTIKRIISIDSQYRTNKQDITTKFTFNLSEPLKDVLSLKLYSVQIPYTWYTISNNYGSNFFYLKGNAPGINQGNNDYKFEIQAGNYTPIQLAAAVNASIQNVMSTYTDISFGNTQYIYNQFNSLSTLNLDITQQFNETSYYLNFPKSSWISPAESTEKRLNSIPGLLGYNFLNYKPYTLKSNYIPIINNSNNAINRIYQINDSNNYFTVYKYIGPNPFVLGSNLIDLSFNIQLSLPQGIYTLNEVLNNLNTQIINNIYLSSEYSYIKTEYLIDSSFNNNTSYFELALKTNRFTTNNIPNSKLCVIFPDESYITTPYYPTWTGLNSGFQFTNRQNEMNTIPNETPIISQTNINFLIDNSTNIILSCINPGFIAKNNNFKINIPPTNIGYKLTEYITAINTGITNTISNNSIFYAPNTTAFIDPTGFFNIQFDMTQNITQNNFIVYLDGYVDVSNNKYWSVIDASNTYGSDILKNKKSSSSLLSDLCLNEIGFIHSDLSYNNILNLSTNNIFDSSFLYKGNYNFNTRYLAYIKATPNNNNVSNDISYCILTPPDSNGNYYGDPSFNYTNISVTYNNLSNVITNQFTNYIDLDNQQIFKGTVLELTGSNQTENNTFISSKLKIIINKILSQNDYSIQFTDATNNQLLNYSQTSWYNYLDISSTMIKTPFPLKTLNQLTYKISSYSGIRSYKSIGQETIKLTALNNTFELIPFEKGVDTPENIITITIPCTDANRNPITYNRDSLIAEINKQFQQNPLTIGSVLELVNENIGEYRFRINVNKIYTANDYNLVFYDQISFVKCYVGVSSVRNTTWDSTLGWILGFRLFTTYNLSTYPIINNVVSITGDTGVSTNLYNYFLICLDDFNQNHLNDGLVTITGKDTSIPLPSYASRVQYSCDPVTGKPTYNTTTITEYNKLTQKQIYTISQINNAQYSTSDATTQSVSVSSYGSGPFVQDVFGLIPAKTAGLTNGSSYVEFGGTLQNQERLYFGPVNITRMKVQLVTDRGDVIDLNGANWSFSLICEQLYNQ